MSDTAAAEPSEPEWLWVTNCAGSYADTTLRMYRKSYQSHEFAVGKPRQSLIYTREQLAERGVVGVYARVGSNAEKAVSSGRSDTTSSSTEAA